MWRWLPPILWMVIILILSSDVGSDTTTSRFILPLLRFLFPGLAPDTYHLVHTGIRKSWHIAEYGILSLLWARALAGPRAHWQARHIGGALCISVFVAIMDEWHQAFEPSRGASVTDLGIDALGAVLGLVGRWIVRRGDTL